MFKSCIITKCCSPSLPVGQDFIGQAVQLYGSPMFYFAVLVLAAVTMLPVLMVKV